MKEKRKENKRFLYLRLGLLSEQETRKRKFDVRKCIAITVLEKEMKGKAKESQGKKRCGRNVKKC